MSKLSDQIKLGSLSHTGKTQFRKAILRLFCPSFHAGRLFGIVAGLDLWRALPASNSPQATDDIILQASETIAEQTTRYLDRASGVSNIKWTSPDRTSLFAREIHNYLKGMILGWVKDGTCQNLEMFHMSEVTRFAHFGIEEALELTLATSSPTIWVDNNQDLLGIYVLEPDLVASNLALYN